MRLIDETAELLRGMTGELRRDPAGAATGAALMLGAGMAVDFAPVAVIPLATIGVSVIGFAAQYLLTRRVMRSGGLLSPDAPRAVALYFGLTFLCSLAITLGLVFLIVPGVWLYARWLASAPTLFAEDTAVSTAMGTSAQRSAPIIGPIVGAAAVVYAPLLAAMGVLLSVYADAPLGITASAVANTAITVSQILSCYLSVAVYRATLPQPLATIFE